MAWWFATPLVIWGVKKIYDAITEDDIPSYSSGSSKTVSSAKLKRTHERKVILTKIIVKHRNSIIKQSSLESEFVRKSGRGEDSVFSINLNNLQRELENFSNLAHELGLPYDCAKTDTKLPIFKSLDGVIRDLIKQADIEYGDMAGINNYNEYDVHQDPFLNKLKKYN